MRFEAHRQGKKECRSHAFRRFGPHSAPMAFHHLASDRESYPRAFHFPRMQALEKPEDPLGKLLLEASAVIRHGKDPVARIALRRDFDPGRLFTPILYGI